MHFCIQGQGRIEHRYAMIGRGQKNSLAIETSESICRAKCISTAHEMAEVVRRSLPSRYRAPRHGRWADRGAWQRRYPRSWKITRFRVKAKELQGKPSATGNWLIGRWLGSARSSSFICRAPDPEVPGARPAASACRRPRRAPDCSPSVRKTIDAGTWPSRSRQRPGCDGMPRSVG